MNDMPDTTRQDDAADAIRGALPTPDQGAAERIARRIAEGERKPVLATRPSPRPGRRRVGMLRPTLAAGAVMVAGAVALLAPGDDPTSPERGLLALGPDAAAAEVFALVSDAARIEDWHPLRDGELHYTRQVERSPGRRLISTSEQWQAADGTMHFRLTEEPSAVPAGETIYVPASECIDMEAFARGAAPIPPSDRTLPVGTTPPACWANQQLSPLLAEATGEIIAAPPAGAYVELPLGPGLDDREMRWGSEAFEGTDRQPIPPGLSAPSGTVAKAVVPEFQPYQLPPSTTWVAVTAGPVVRIDREFSVPTAVASGIPGFVTWELAFTLAELEVLPTDAAQLLARLRTEGSSIDADITNIPSASPPLGLGSAGIDPDAATMSLTLDLITKAPISPEVRAAAFEALGSLKMSGQPATVDRNAEFPDGSPAIAVEFPIVYPKMYEYPGSAGDSARMLFDPQTAAFRSSIVELGTQEYVTTYDPPRRVSEVPPVD